MKINDSVIFTKRACYWLVLHTILSETRRILRGGGKVRVSTANFVESSSRTDTSTCFQCRFLEKVDEEYWTIGCFTCQAVWKRSSFSYEGSVTCLIGDWSRTLNGS